MKASEKALILPVTFGSMFEWFEVFLYVYWTPILSKAFFDLSLPMAEFIHATLILGTGLVARPIGGLLFGYIGDVCGRKAAFLLSIIVLIIPSIGIAFIPSFSTWAYASIVYLGLVRFFQGIPAGGELPGALCLLAEGAQPHRQKYVCSYLFIGPQIGQSLSMLLCLLLQKFLTKEQLLSWGWRLSFLVGGAIGLIGFFLRRKLFESRAFEDLKIHHKIEKHPLHKSFKKHKKDMFLGFTISIFEVTGFFVIFFYIFQSSAELFQLSIDQNLLVNLIFLLIVTILMPIVGKIGDLLDNRLLFKISAIGAILTSIPFYFSISLNSNFWTFLFVGIMTLFLCIQFGLLPSLIANLYPTQVRFTCIGFSLNISDAVIGGIIPLVSTSLVHLTGISASIVILFAFTALIFLICLKYVKPEVLTKRIQNK